MNRLSSQPTLRVMAFAACVAMPALMGQSSSGLSGPSQGFTFDPASLSLREVVGSLGSATLGAAVLKDVEFASAAPQRSHGIACALQQCFIVTGLNSSEPQKTEIPGQSSIPEGAAWSADGSAVVIYSRTGQWLRGLRGMPGTPEIQPQLSLSSLGGSLASVALDPDGHKVTISLVGDHTGVFEVTDAGAFIPVLGAENPIALAYSANGQSLYVLDAAAHAITEIQTISGLPASWPIEEVADPAGLQTGSDATGRAVIYVAGRNDRTLFVYDGASHALTERISLDFSPSQLQPVGAGSFLLTSRSSPDELLWSYAAGRGAFFIPVTPLETGAADTNAPHRKVRR